MKAWLFRTAIVALLTLPGGMSAKAFAQETVIIPTRVIYPGQTITSDAIREVPLRRQVRDIAALAVDWAQLEGKVASRTLLPGRLIHISSVRDAWLVEPGAPVQVRFVHDGLEISVSGVPLQHGSAGDMIKVRNMDSGTIFTGIVMADGSIRVAAS